MQRVPLSTPAHAAALVAVGFPRSGVKLDPLHHTGTGEKHMGWFYEGTNGADAADLMRRRRPDLANALWRSDPAHPFLAALAGIHNYEVLEEWEKNPLHPPAGALAQGNRLLLLKASGQPGGSGAMYTHVAPAGFASVQTAELAAALIAVGFPPAPRMRSAGTFLISERSFLYPHLTLPRALEACRLMRDPSQLLPVQLEPFRAGQHPLQFAYAAAANYLTVPDSERRAWPYTTYFFRGRRTALANADALRNTRLEEQIMEHVAGV